MQCWEYNLFALLHSPKVLLAITLGLNYTQFLPVLPPVTWQMRPINEKVYPMSPAKKTVIRLPASDFLRLERVGEFVERVSPGFFGWKILRKKTHLYLPGWW